MLRFLSGNAAWERLQVEDGAALSRGPHRALLQRRQAAEGVTLRQEVPKRRLRKLLRCPLLALSPLSGAARPVKLGIVAWSLRVCCDFSGQRYVLMAVYWGVAVTYRCQAHVLIAECKIPLNCGRLHTLTATRSTCEDGCH